MPHLTIVDHPLVQHKLTEMRDKTTPPPIFRRRLREISFLLAYDAMKNLDVTTREIETPLEAGSFPALEGKDICLVSILRAGNGLLEGILDLVPEARVGHVGLYRDHETLEAVEYYFKVPEAIEARQIFVVDPMLATGHSSAAALTKLKEAGAKRMKFICLVAAPEGVDHLADQHPDVPIYTAALDRQLSEIGYILPGLGDAGDRIYGTV